MTAESISPKTNYRHLYNFLVVLNEGQITKLRNIVIGAKDVTAFTETEIQELETKLKERRERSKPQREFSTR